MSGRIQHLKIQHIYREFNRKADQLSKQTLLMEEEILFFAKKMGEQVGSFEKVTEY
jgi:hypothetical protein